MSTAALEDRCHEEVVDLHRFFEAWFNGAPDVAPLARFSDVMAPSFQIIMPSGDVFDHDGIVARVENAEGMTCDAPIRIWIEHFHARVIEPPLVLATYEEWQAEGTGTPLGRRSSVLLRDAPVGPFRVSWLHLHETAIG